jgi:hypothetical protein
MVREDDAQVLRTGLPTVVLGLSGGIIDSLAPAPPDATRIDLLLQFIVAVAAEQDGFRDREFGPIHLLKYVYLADVAFAERHDGNTYTGTAWQFHHFGPWSVEVFNRIEPALSTIGVEPKRIPSRFTDDAVRYGLPVSEAARVRSRGDSQLPSAVQFSITRAVHQFGSDTGSLLRAVYLTAPMLNAAPEERLDFATAVRERPPAYATASDTVASKSQQKLRQRRLAEIRAEVQSRLASVKQSRRVLEQAPRYDEVFREGVEWLDRLAGEAVPEAQGRLSVADDVWKSETRREPEVP